MAAAVSADQGREGGGEGPPVGRNAAASGSAETDAEEEEEALDGAEAAETGAQVPMSAAHSSIAQRTQRSKLRQSDSGRLNSAASTQTAHRQHTDSTQPEGSDGTAAPHSHTVLAAH